jgi:hypothetical protein
MDKWFKDILPDKDPYHNRGRDQMRKKVGRDSSACDKERYKIDDEEILCERDLFKLVGDLSWKKGATCLESEGDLS